MRENFRRPILSNDSVLPIKYLPTRSRFDDLQYYCNNGQRYPSACKPNPIKKQISCFNKNYNDKSNCSSYISNRLNPNCANRTAKCINNANNYRNLNRSPIRVINGNDYSNRDVCIRSPPNNNEYYCSNEIGGYKQSQFNKFYDRERPRHRQCYYKEPYLLSPDHGYIYLPPIHDYKDSSSSSGTSSLSSNYKIKNKYNKSQPIGENPHRKIMRILPKNQKSSLKKNSFSSASYNSKNSHNKSVSFNNVVEEINIYVSYS